MTWSVPEQFGGMTSALLHRSRAFVRLGGVPVDVLTFDPQLDSVAVERRLRQSGELIDGMRLLNLYDWFRTTPVGADAGGSLDLRHHPFRPLESAPAGRTRTRSAPDGSLLQIDHYRADGTLVVSDRRDVTEPGRLGGRVVVLCDAAGNPVRSWTGIWGLYRFWLDELRSREPSFFIVDSKTVAPFAMTYRRKRAVMLHLVHASHLVGTDPTGPLRESRREVFEHLGETPPNGFDSVVLLTERQRDDVVARFGETPKLVVIPNSRDFPARGAVLRGPVGHGVVLASLTSRKRVDHAIRAVAEAAARVPGVALDVFGEGEARTSLEGLVGELQGVDVVLHGYRQDARERLESASYLLLTAHSEGFPLVLIEAMAAGCIPICYDVPYGPADLVVPGQTGFLVAPGDIDGLAGAIADLVRMPPRKVERMRQAARRAARRFSDLEVTRAWANEERRAEQRKLAAWPQQLAG
jgi:poly(glycerol-phosphate) alpha-glucosyltransferase